MGPVDLPALIPKKGPQVGKYTTLPLIPSWKKVESKKILTTPRIPKPKYERIPFTGGSKGPGEYVPGVCWKLLRMK